MREQTQEILLQCQSKVSIAVTQTSKHILSLSNIHVQTNEDATKMGKEKAGNEMWN